MRFLANENFPLDAVEALGQNGHDVLWIRVESPGISDREVLSRAQAENRILLTFDQDFGELAFRSRLLASVGIILFRIRVPSGSVVAEKVAKVISLRDDWYGHFTVIEEDKIRMRDLTVRCRRHCVAVRRSCRVRSLMWLLLLHRSIFGERTMHIYCGFKCVP
jgi:predicted nuclease of predicted toxin-antitoxin system